jgi:hypothetical protein
MMRHVLNHGLVDLKRAWPSPWRYAKGEFV